MTTLRSNQWPFPAIVFVLCMAAVVLLGLPRGASAEEGDGRPWGRLNKPLVTAPETTRQTGYLGRYNPWARSGENASAEPAQPPRYRQREDGNGSSRAEGLSPYSGVPASPAAQQYAPMPPRYYGYGQIGGGGYPAPPVSPYPGGAPWGGGLSPDYGSYMPGPYNNLQPNTGILWSDMWR